MLTMDNMAEKPVEDGVIYLNEQEFAEYVRMPYRMKLMRKVHDEGTLQGIIKDMLAGRRQVVYFKHEVRVR